MDHAGIKDIEVHLIPDARHDALHEEKNGGAEAAIDIIQKWMNEKKAQ